MGLCVFHYIWTGNRDPNGMSIYECLLQIKLFRDQWQTHTETSQFIRKANQLAGFYVGATLTLNGFQHC